jgi:hypothetical protein
LFYECPFRTFNRAKLFTRKGRGDEKNINPKNTYNYEKDVIAPIAGKCVSSLLYYISTDENKGTDTP